jgi:hypothetical protein
MVDVIVTVLPEHIPETRSAGYTYGRLSQPTLIPHGPSQRRPTIEVKAALDVGHNSVSKEIAYVPNSLKASLYAESAEGFGLWRIFLSGKATNDLGRRMKDDAKIYQITINRLRRVLLLSISMSSIHPGLHGRELSHGRFSKANHKRLTGPQTPVHIFRARLPGDSRIVVSFPLTMTGLG